MRYKGPSVKTRNVFCVKCDAPYRLGFNARNYALSPRCPRRECGCEVWSLRRKAEVDALVAKYLPLAYHQLGRRTVPQDAKAVEGDMLESAALWALYSSARLWDENYRHPVSGEPVKFITYATRAIRSHLGRAVSDELRAGIVGRPVRNKGKLLGVNMHVRITPSGGDEMPCDPADRRVREAPEACIANERTERVHATLKRLHGQQRKILQLRFFEGKTLEEVGEVMGLTRERIRQIELQAIKRMRKEIGR